MELNADVEDVVQAEPVDQGVPVPVAVSGPVETRELPAVRAGYRTEPNVGAIVGVRLLNFEPRRKSAVLIPMSQDIWISTSQAGVQAGSAGAARIPAGVPYTIGHLDKVFVCAVSGTTDVSVLTEYWTE